MLHDKITIAKTSITRLIRFNKFSGIFSSSQYLSVLPYYITNQSNLRIRLKGSLGIAVVNALPGNSQRPHKTPARIVLESKIMGFSSILLASNSPRRQQLLSWTGWQFNTCPVPVDETPFAGEKPYDYVRRLAESKGRAALAQATQAGQDIFVLAADTIVLDGGELLGKPRRAAEATAMLERLRGHVHQVLTALAIFAPLDGQLYSDLCVANVRMRDYSDAEIARYVASRDPLDKAGGYAIQNPGFHPVTDFNGCYACVVGLPLCHLLRTLLKAGFYASEFNSVHKSGLDALVDVPGACQANLEYLCPVTKKILNGEM
jgi:MAF protein